MRRVHRIENQEEEEEMTSENAVEAEGTQESDNALETTGRKQKVVTLKRPPPFTLNILVNIAKTLF